jgi:hypothetical protein
MIIMHDMVTMDEDNEVQQDCKLEFSTGCSRAVQLYSLTFT